LKPYIFWVFTRVALVIYRIVIFSFQDRTSTILTRAVGYDALGTSSDFNRIGSLDKQDQVIWSVAKIQNDEMIYIYLWWTGAQLPE